MNFKGNPWTAQEDEQLLLMYEKKMTYQEIAGFLDRTREAIAGRLRRIKNRGKSESAKKRKPPVIIPNDEGTIHLKDIKSNQCHFPCGDLYCGKSSNKPYGYCDYHHSKVFSKIYR